MQARRPPYVLTFRLAVVAWLKLPLTPVIVSVKVPLGPVADVVTLSVEVVVAGSGVSVTVEPEGWPPTLSVTVPPKPLDGVIVTV